ncbi:MAG: restriction endonuclease subunit S [Desulfobulbus sp.]|nr:restriction endonuclease subunit S [Desulfobulbus sp.]
MKINNLRIEDVCDFVGGSQPPKSEFIPEPREGYVRLIQIRDYKTDSFPTYIPKKSTKKFCDENDIMIGRYGPPIFQICRGLKGAYNVALLKAKPKRNIDREYLYYFLKQESVFQYVDKLSARTGGQTGVDLVSLNKYPIRLPEQIEDQKKIAAVLSVLDAKIDCNNRINAELEAMAKALYDYWFVQFDFPDANGKPYKSSGGKRVYNSTLKREIPVGWEAWSLKNLVEVVKGNVSPSDIDASTPYIGLEHIGRKTIALSDWATSDSANSDKTAFKKNDILFGKIRPYFHKVVAAPFDGITSTDTIILRPKKKNFFGLALETVFSDEFIESATQSSTGSKMPRADWSVLQHYKIPVPKTDLLEAYQSAFEGVLKKIYLSSIENKKLSDLRDWLLPMLMSGQATVT